MKRLLHTRGTTVSIVSILAVLAVGGGYAIASGSGNIKACVHKHGRGLYRAPCRKGDKTISWNQTGPRGPRGPKGSPGSPGAPGPSHAYSSVGSSLIDFNGTADADTTVASVTVPGGNYAVTGEAVANSNGGSQGSFTCRLEGPVGTVIDAGPDAINLGSNGQLDRAYDGVMGTATLTTAGTIAVICQSSGTSGNYVQHGILATRVGGVN